MFTIGYNTIVDIVFKNDYKNFVLQLITVELLGASFLFE